MESGLESIKKADVKIVLGHHPIRWFKPDDEKSICALFGKNNVIYLHGHLHENSSRLEEGAGHLFLNAQSGAAFQAREDDVWVNGLMWGEWNADDQRIEVEPYCWNKNHQEWSPDAQAFPNAYRIENTTRYAIPFGAALKAGVESKHKQKQVKKYTTPEGWSLLTRESLENINRNPDESVILSYFDGRIPNMGLALCEQIPRREIVKKISERLVAGGKSDLASINLILGAGGEGKSTAFLQIIESVLVEGDGNWKVIHRRADGAGLGKRMVDELPKDGHQWLIASDDADLISDDVYRIAFGLQSEGRNDVHFLLSARHTDWRKTKTTPPQWERMPGYHEDVLRGLNHEDAALIVDAWASFHEKGLGRLAGLPKGDAVKRLVEETRSEKSQDEGAFLGALLRLRFGEQLRTHVKKLLDRLHERKIVPENPSTLLDAFAYIAAMHAENKLFLSKNVLSKALGIDPRQLRSKVLWPLGEEAAADVAGDMVFTRHRAIAETALDILDNTLYYEVELTDVYVELVKASRMLFTSNEFVPNVADWKFLSDYFFNEKNNHALGINLAKAVIEVDATDAHARVKLAQLFRKAGHPEQAIPMLRESPKTELRGFFNEWAISEGYVGNSAVNVWLDAVALSDDVSRTPPDNKTVAMCLTALGKALSKLYRDYNKRIFVEGCVATGCLGMKLPHLNSTDKRHFLGFLEMAQEVGVEMYESFAAIKCIQEAVDECFNQREAEMPEWVERADELTFNSLTELFK